MKDTSYNPFTMAQKQFDNAAELLELDQATRDLLRVPLREFQFSIPVRMDDGQVKVFRGFRVQHNDARGPGKGGIRFHPQETIDTVRALIDVDDLEMRCGGYSAGWGKRWSDL